MAEHFSASPSARQLLAHTTSPYVLFASGRACPRANTPIDSARARAHADTLSVVFPPPLPALSLVLLCPTAHLCSPLNPLGRLSPPTCSSDPPPSCPVLKHPPAFSACLLPPGEFFSCRQPRSGGQGVFSCAGIEGADPAHLFPPPSIQVFLKMSTVKKSKTPAEFASTPSPEPSRCSRARRTDRSCASRPALADFLMGEKTQPVIAAVSKPC